MTVPKVGSISDLCASLSALSSVPAEKVTVHLKLLLCDHVFTASRCFFLPIQMIVTDIYNHRFHRIFATNENLSSIIERDDIYV